MRPRAAVHGDAAALYRATMDFIRFYQFRDRGRAVRYGLTAAYCHVIDLLERNGPLSLNALADLLYLDKSTASRIVAMMGRRRLVKRTADPRDGRGLQITATALGRSRYARVVEDIVSQNADLLADYSPDARRRFISLLGSLTRLGIERDGLANPDT